MKEAWIYLSAFGICFAALSWISEIGLHGEWKKGAYAAALGIILCKIFLRKV